MAKRASGKGAGITVRWLPEPQEHDYPAALSYLSLVQPEKTARELVKALKQASMTSTRRASCRPARGRLTAAIGS
jgi:hypothetical protein